VNTKDHALAAGLLAYDTTCSEAKDASHEERKQAVKLVITRLGHLAKLLEASQEVSVLVLAPGIACMHRDVREHHVHDSGARSGKQQNFAARSQPVLG
jgi:hypothetical protein